MSQKKGVDSMKKIMIFLCLILSLTVSAQIQYEWKVSKIHSLVHFLRAISGEVYHSKNLKLIFEDSEFYTEESQKNLKEFTNDMNDLKKIKVHQEGDLNLFDLFVIQSSNATSLDDLSKRFLGYMPLPKHALFMKRLLFWEKVYTKLIWNKDVELLKVHQKKLDEYAKKAKISDVITTLVQYFDVTWPDNISFRTELIPVPNDKTAERHIYYAYVQGNINTMEVMIEKKSRARSSYAVTIFSIIGALMEIKFSAKYPKLKEWFVQEDPEVGSEAFELFTNSFPAAMSFGWAIENSEGSAHEGNWYAHEKENKYAREMYPDIKKSLNAKEKFSRKFVRKAIKIYRKLFL